MKIVGFILFAFCSSALADTGCKHLKSNKPFVEENTCPYHCQFGEWSAKADLDVYDRPEGKIVGRFKTNDKFKALKGQTHVIPANVKIISKPPEHINTKLKVSDSFYLLSYQGEGLSGACMDDKVEIIDCTGIENHRLCAESSDSSNSWARITNGEGAEGKWWVQVSSSKISGWILHSFNSVKGSTYSEPEN